jgi:membrane-bound serine protease (ClpP class)
MRRTLSVLVSTLAFAMLAAAFAAQSPEKAVDHAVEKAGLVTLLDVNGAIGPATSRYIERGLEAAKARNSQLVILKMDTPGGLDTSMRDIIRAILASTVPVATYVAPSGARAASAGTYILYASHVAAMAPATNLGAATPVSIGGEPPPERGTPGDAGDEDEKTAPQSAERRNPRAREPGSAMERKVINDAVAYIRGLAELRGRNGDWAEDAVRGAASLSASAAFSQKVIDIVARDVPDLLDQVDGREIKLASGTVKLATRGLTVEHLEPDWRTKLLSVITNPTIAYGLLLVGIYGLLFEGYNPGAVLPGVVGAIALITALFAFQILSVNYAGLALIGLGVAMMVAEFFVPSFGALGLGGLTAFVVGSIILLDTDTPGLNIGLPIIAAVATFGGAMIIGTGWLARRSMKRPVVTGAQAMIGATAEVFEDFEGKGTVRFGGELWNATSRVPLRKGQQVRITRVEGLLLWVEPA